MARRKSEAKRFKEYKRLSSIEKYMEKHNLTLKDLYKGELKELIRKQTADINKNLASVKTEKQEYSATSFKKRLFKVGIENKGKLGYGFKGKSTEELIKQSEDIKFYKKYDIYTPLGIKERRKEQIAEETKIAKEYGFKNLKDFSDFAKRQGFEDIYEYDEYITNKARESIYQDEYDTEYQPDYDYYDSTDGTWKYSEPEIPFNPYEREDWEDEWNKNADVNERRWKSFNMNNNSNISRKEWVEMFGMMNDIKNELGESFKYEAYGSTMAYMYTENIKNPNNMMSALKQAKDNLLARGEALDVKKLVDEMTPLLVN